MTKQTEIPQELYQDVVTLFAYNQMEHEIRPCAVGVGLGCHDLGVATYAAELFHRGMFPLLVFTGANSHTTVDLFPKGEAFHFRQHAVALGVPEDAFLVEARATNTRENIEFTRALLLDHGLVPDSVLVVSRPYQQRRAYATCTLLWPGATVICTSQPLLLPDYVASIGNAKLVIDMIVGDTERVIEYPKRGHAAKQDVPPPVVQALTRLIHAGFTSRCIGAGE
jgi:uncharacterized SAM-binding protein YcdF (DUF218 family)